MKYEKQLFGSETASETTTGFDKGVYCDFSANAVKALAGKDILLAVWNAEGTAISAIAGQQSLKLNRSADSIEVTTKIQETVGRHTSQDLRSGQSTQMVCTSTQMHQCRHSLQPSRMETRYALRYTTRRPKRVCLAVLQLLQTSHLRHLMMTQ